MISNQEKKKYPLLNKKDKEILELIHDLEELNLSEIELFLTLWTRTQLEYEWRKPLIDVLKLIKKNSKKSKKERKKIIFEYAEKNFWKPE